MRQLKAAATYAAAAFALGFLLGTIRLLFVVPHVGETIAAVIETPVMLAASWGICRWCMRRFHIPAVLEKRAAVGALAFLILIGLEVALGTLLFGRSLAEQLQAFTDPAGLVGIGAQLLFATMPGVQMRGDEEGESVVGAVGIEPTTPPV